jgi:hypothetical protein
MVVRVAVVNGLGFANLFQAQGLMQSNYFDIAAP